MKIECNHCGQRLDIDDDRAATTIDCPNCQQSITVPPAPAQVPPRPAPAAKASAPRAPGAHVRAPSSRKPKAKKSGGGGGAKFLLFLVLLTVGAFGYAMFRYDQSPRETWKRLVEQAEAYLRPVPQPTPAPTPSPTPEPTPAPTATPQPPPTSEATPEPTPDPVAWLIEHRASWPREVTLLKKTEFPVVLKGRVAGHATLLAGMTLTVMEIRPDAITVEYRGAQKQLPLDATDLSQRAVGAMAAAEAAQKATAETPESPAQTETQPDNTPVTTAMATPAAGPAPVLKAPEHFVHPGCLSTLEDLKRMAAMVKADKQPWSGSWEKLVGNTNRFMKDKPEAQPTIKAGGGGGDTYIRLARDCARSYQLALRYHGSGDKKFADKAVEILNAWAAKHEKWAGDTNCSLRAGIYGYQFACAAELLRKYPGWDPKDFKKFQEYMKKMFYNLNHDFLTRRHGTVPTHYFANWGHANLASMIAIGVLCDDKAIFEEALEFFYHGSGNESIENAVVFRHPDGLGQWQESGRDQGHSLMGPQLMGTICEIAWNQGIDFYGYDDNRFLSGVEYISKYNTGHDVPWVVYDYVHGQPGQGKLWVMKSIASGTRGAGRPGWDLVYNHYVNRRGMAAPFTEEYAEMNRPEGGGFNYGGSSGGFDGLGFTTLTHSLEPIEKGAPPSALLPVVQGRQVALSWAGTAGALGYEVKRANSKAGPYTTVGQTKPDELAYVDTRLEPAKTYYYVVSARTKTGSRLDSAPIAVTATKQLQGKPIGTEDPADESGVMKTVPFDGYLENWYEAPGDQPWVGLDLGEGVSAVISEVKYFPRKGQAGRMLNGKFQGSSSPDFTSGVEDLCTISSTPKEGEFAARKVENRRAFRYVRYLSPQDGHGNVAEIQFYGDLQGASAKAR